MMTEDYEAARELIDAMYADLADHHEAEAKYRGAHITNFGWVSGGDAETFSITSKTDCGILTSVINKDTRRVAHEWDCRD